MTELYELGAWEAAEKLAAGTLTCEALTRACLARIAAVDLDHHAWVHLDPEMALAAARQRDREPRRGVFHGIPIGIKDVLDTADMPSCYGTPIFAGWRPKADSACVTILKRAGGVILGKTVTQAFACGIPIEVNNGLNPNFTAGGSSSGSVAAVAARMVPVAIGTQSASSLIRPASYNGLVGMRPTLGMISVAGFKYFNGSFDTIGLLARSVDDLALLFQVQLEIAPKRPEPGPSRPRIGLCRTPWWKHVEPPMRAALEGAADLFGKAGAQVSEVELPADFADLDEVHTVMQAFEAARSYAWEWEHHRDQMDERVTGIIELGLRTPYETYRKLAQRAVAARTRFAALAADYDALLAPSAPGEPPPSKRVAGPGFEMGNTIMSRGWTLLHLPCITLPHFTGPQGMPLGVQLIGQYAEDERLIALAKWGEQVFAKA